MLSRFRPSPAMVVACLALFVALGGSAVAVVTSFVGRDGKIHGCVTAQGQLTLVKPGQPCTKGSPVVWNQKGPRGNRGPRGFPGPRGLQGPGAVSMNTNVGLGTSGPLGGHFDGVTAGYECGAHAIALDVDVPTSANHVFVSGDQAVDGNLSSVQAAPNGEYNVAANNKVNLDVIAMNDGVGKWTRFDLGGFHGNNGCNFWGVVIPGS